MTIGNPRKGQRDAALGFAESGTPLDVPTYCTASSCFFTSKFAPKNVV